MTPPTPRRKLEGKNPFLSPIVNDDENAAHCHYHYWGRIWGRGGGGPTTLQSTLALRWNNISSTYSCSSPSPSYLHCWPVILYMLYLLLCSSTGLNIDILSVITTCPKTRSINGDDDILTGGYCHPPSTIISTSAVFAIFAPARISSAFSNTSHQSIRGGLAPWSVFRFVIFVYVPPHREWVGGTRPRLNLTKEGGFGHCHPNYDVVVAVDVNFPPKPPSTHPITSIYPSPNPYPNSSQSSHTGAGDSGSLPLLLLNYYTPTPIIDMYTPQKTQYNLSTISIYIYLSIYLSLYIYIYLCISPSPES